MRISEKKLNYNLIVFLIIILGIFLRWYNLNFEDFWHDEMVSFWLANPNLNFYETLNLIYESNLTVSFELFLKYFHLIFGYDIHLSRYFNLLISALSIYYFFKLLENNSYIFLKKNNEYVIYLGLFLICLNIFHIRYAFEVRSYTLTFLLAIILINQIFKNEFIKEKFSVFDYFKISIVVTAMLFSHAFSILIIISLNIYIFLLFVLKKNNSKNILVIFIINTLISIFFLYSYLKGISHTPDWITQIKPSFYTNFFFSSFFGSRIMGGVYFLILVFLIYSLFGKIIKNFGINCFFLILIFITYLLPIIYSYVYSPILIPRYIFFILIPILYLIANLVFSLKGKRIKKIIISILLLLTFLNHFTENTFKQFYTIIYPSKPEVRRALTYINNSDIKDYSFLMDDVNKHNVNLVYENYLTKYSAKVSKKLRFINYKKANRNNEMLWLIYLTDTANGKPFVIPSELDKYKIDLNINFNHVQLYLINKNES